MYYRRPYAIKTQQKAINATEIPLWNSDHWSTPLHCDLVTLEELGRAALPAAGPATVGQAVVQLVTRHLNSSFHQVQSLGQWTY